MGSPPGSEGEPEYDHVVTAAESPWMLPEDPTSWVYASVRAIDSLGRFSWYAEMAVVIIETE